MNKLQTSSVVNIITSDFQAGTLVTKLSSSLNILVSCWQLQIQVSKNCFMHLERTKGTLSTHTIRIWVETAMWRLCRSWFPMCFGMFEMLHSTGKKPKTKSKTKQPKKKKKTKEKNPNNPNNNNQKKPKPTKQNPTKPNHPPEKTPNNWGVMFLWGRCGSLANKLLPHRGVTWERQQPPAPAEFLWCRQPHTVTNYHSMNNIIKQTQREKINCPSESSYLAKRSMIVPLHESLCVQWEKFSYWTPQDIAT